MKRIVYWALVILMTWGGAENLGRADTPPTQPVDRPFQLPFAQPSGLDTWLLAQPYGNTTGAYRQRFTTYGASGGIHFGVDLSTPCGTEVRAIADGVVFAVDGPFGSPPHNLMIDHPDLGYASMYGHLLEKPALQPGQPVKQGDVVALSGDSAELCYRRPHLHLEIRDLNHIRKYNPHLLIEANWDSLAQTGSEGRAFARNLAAPRQWQSLYDQPEVQTGGPIVNDFAEVWPLDWREREGAAVPVSLVAASAVSTQTTVSLAANGVGRQITPAYCCTLPFWSDDSTQVRFIDQPSSNEPLGVWAVEVARPQPAPQLVTERLGVVSPDGRLLAYPDRDKGLAVIERLADGQQWTLDTQGRNLSFTPDSRHVIWVAYDEDAEQDTRQETLWLADTDGLNVRAVFSARRTDTVGWLSADTLLMSRSLPGTSDRQLFTLSLTTGKQTEWRQESQMRGLAFSPDRRYLVYYISFNTDPAKNGVWLADLQNMTQPPQKLPFFGTYRWRDANRLIYAPFDPTAIEHNFFEYNVASGQTRPMFPAGTGLTIANNDWEVSPDGRKIALVAANGTALNGIWVLDLN